MLRNVPIEFLLSEYDSPADVCCREESGRSLMFPLLRRQSAIVIALLLAACPILMGSANERDGGDPRATITFANHTSCPVFVYINRRFIDRCEPCLVLTVKSPIVGEVEVAGRFRCETYGPR